MPTTIISRARSETGPQATLVDGLATALAAGGHEVLLAPDLYHLPAEDPLWQRLAGLQAPALLSWLQPRAAQWLLRRRGLNCDGWRLLSLEAVAESDEPAAGLLPGRAGSSSAGGSVTSLAPASPLPQRWYPVVDLSRCTNCGHCLQFCLFGVYETAADGTVAVAQPDNCKAGCPACSRVCPAGAIVFPLYRDDPAICGAPGQFVQRDAAARRMFYARTEQPCPLCAAKTEADIAALSTDGCCPECGRELESVPPSSAALDEIDALISRLDSLARRED